MRRSKLLCAWLVLSFAFMGCKDKEAPKDVNEAAPAPSAPALPPAVTTPPPPPEQALPTEADFEEEATQQITSKNLEEELDKLERELKSP